MTYSAQRLSELSCSPCDGRICCDHASPQGADCMSDETSCVRAADYALKAIQRMLALSWLTGSLGCALYTSDVTP